MPGSYRKNHNRAIQAKSPSKRPPVPARPPSRPQQSPGKARVPVRPAGPPQKVMPKRPASPPARPASRPHGPASRPSEPASRPGGPASRPTGSASRPTGSTIHKPAPGQPAFRSIGAQVTGLALLNTASAHEDISIDISSLNSALQSLQQKSSFTNIQSEVLDLDGALNKLNDALESVRKKGYCFQPDLEDKVYQATGRWDSIREKVVSTADQQAHAFQSRLPSLNPHIQRLNTTLRNPTTAASVIGSTRSQVDNMLSEVERLERSIREQYSPIETQANELARRLNEINWALDQLPQALLKLDKGEDLVIAVASRWDKEGKDDPEGNLFLTNKRLVYERKQKVSTKKVLFITTASELVHDTLIDQSLSNVKSVKAEGKGLFGHQDFMVVEFNDSKLGTVAFHLRGQDSKMWCDLVERARNGRLDRATGAGVSAVEMTRTITNADVLALQSEINKLQDEMMLQEARQELARLENEVHSLARRLSGLRSRGYAIEKDMEDSITVLDTQWSRIKRGADAAIDQQSRTLSDQMRSIQQLTSQLMGASGSGNGDAMRSLYLQAKSSAASASSQAQAAKETVALMYERYGLEVESIGAHLAWVDWMLDALETACFQLSASEFGIAATEAVWEQPGLEAENGILYLTGDRLLWEDRVGAYELKVNVPLQYIAEVRKETPEAPDPEAGAPEILVFTFSSGAPMHSARFQLSLPIADDWLQMIGRARSGGYLQDLAIKLAPEELERIRNAPTHCPGCNAAFTAPILRGQVDITCDYCGAKTRF